MYMLNTITGEIKSTEEWLLDLFDLYITQQDYDNLIPTEHEVYYD